jgi:hypothetical protein
MMIGRIMGRLAKALDNVRRGLAIRVTYGKAYYVLPTRLFLRYLPVYFNE